MAKANVIALIQARGGSKGVPKKNIKPLGRHPMIAYSIAAAELCQDIDRVIVSTESEEIAAIAEDYGAEVPFLRPTEFASDAATDADVIHHALDWLNANEGYKPPLLVQLRPTTPFRNPALISAALDLIRYDAEATSLRSAHPIAEPPQKMFGLNDSGYFEGLFPHETRPEYFHLPRQAFAPTFYPNGYVDIIRSSFVGSAPYATIYGDKILGFTTPFAPEVDTPEDFEYLEFLIARETHPLKAHLDGTKTDRVIKPLQAGVRR
tara:strand:- start:124 stop:915 length:792 start_codon:yes stop_codon:yes gene_type:complete